MIEINGDRLWSRLMEMAQIGKTPKGGVRRLALSDEDKEGRKLFISWCEEANCSIKVDAMGNIFAIRPGKNPEAHAVMTGSHLDSQPTGGKFDGVLGVLAGLEVFETLNDHGLMTDHPLILASWTNEEGARFSPAMIASGVFSNSCSLDYAYSRKDEAGKTIKEELERIDYLGSEVVDPAKIKASIELHIEQGPVLESEKKDIGIVTGVQGIRWYDLHFKGQETHAGPFPMSHRKDPMKSAVRFLESVYRFDEKFGPETRITVGYISSSPSVKNTVPGMVTVSLDLRHPDPLQLEEIDKELHTLANSLNGVEGPSLEIEEIWHSPPVYFDPQCIQAVREASEYLSYSSQEIVSGAGHDSVYLSKVVPASMIFVPCEKGLSHNEAENMTKQEAAKGANVLLHTLLNLAKK